jgi:hypothetical protein
VLLIPKTNNPEPAQRQFIPCATATNRPVQDLTKHFPEGSRVAYIQKHTQTFIAGRVYGWCCVSQPLWQHPAQATHHATTPCMSGSVIQSRAGTTDIKVTSIPHRFCAHTQQFACTKTCITGSWRGTSPGQAHGTHRRNIKNTQFNSTCSAPLIPPRPRGKGNAWGSLSTTVQPLGMQLRAACTRTPSIES